MVKKADLRILMVEDQDDMRMILRTMLHHLGFRRIVEAVDGQEGLSIFEQSARDRIELIIADWNMPRMNGLELLAAIRLREAFGKTPFLMVTSQNDKDNIINAINSGVTDYIVKPFSARILEQKIKACFERPPD